MSSAKPYIGCKIGLISKAQNRYEGILYTIDRVNSTVVLAKVKCFGTEGRHCDIPSPPKDEVYEYITFRGSDIKDITLCEPARAHGLPHDPAIVQSSGGPASSVYSALGPYSPLRISPYNQLAASSLLNQQYAAALGIGLHARRGPMVEKAVQTLRVDRSMVRRPLTASQEQSWETRRPQRAGGESFQARRYTAATGKKSLAVAVAQQNTIQQQDDGNNENRPPRRRQGPRRRRNRSRGQLMVASVPSVTLTFDTDFDFDSSNAQFIKEELEREMQDRLKIRDENQEMEEEEQQQQQQEEKEQSHSNAEDDPFGPKCYYNKAKSFFDNISSDNKFRLTWAEERKRNLETFGVPGRFLRGQSFRGGSTGWRRRGAAQI